MNQEKITPPAERVQFILGEDDLDGSHESHPLFSELEELFGDGADQQWRETARYVFEKIFCYNSLCNLLTYSL